MTRPDDGQASKYRQITELGRGGMGEVVLAVAHGMAGFTKLVVLKRARLDFTEEPHFLAMFLDEARLAARLNHPNVVQTYEAGQDGGRYFIAMEYLDGQPLNQIRTRVGAKSFPLPLQVRILSEALAGLHYAHELTDFDGTSLGVIHRDATPQNIFVTYDGQVKVVDFGIAKAASSTIKTRTGMLKGKMTYLAPEQARADPLDHRVDIFTVGVMLWEAIAGDRMWKNVSTTEVIRRLSAGKLPALPAEAADREPELARICRRALAFAPADRQATAAELQHDLERWLSPYSAETSRRALGAFVVSHFEAERAGIKALLEDELRDYASSARPRLGRGMASSPDLAPSSVDGRGPRSRPFSSSPSLPSAPSARSADPGTTAPESSSPASAAGADSSPTVITMTMRSSTPGDAPPAASPDAPSSPGNDDATFALPRKRLPSAESISSLALTPVSTPIAAQDAAPVAAPAAAPVAAPDAAPVSSRVAARDVAPVSSRIAAPDAAPVSSRVAAQDAAPVSSRVAAPDAAPVSFRVAVQDTAPVSSRVAAPDTAPVSSRVAAPAPAPVPPATAHETLGRSSVSLDTPVEPAPALRSPGRRRKPLAVAIAALIAGAGVAGALAFGWPRALPASDHAAAPSTLAPAGEIDLTIRVSPATAQIFVDGVPVAAGSYKDRIARDGRVHAIRVEAPSFVTMEHSFTASSDVFISLALERQSAPSP